MTVNYIIYPSVSELFLCEKYSLFGGVRCLLLFGIYVTMQLYRTRTYKMYESLSLCVPCYIHIDLQIVFIIRDFMGDLFIYGHKLFPRLYIRHRHCFQGRACYRPFMGYIIPHVQSRNIFMEASIHSVQPRILHIRTHLFTHIVAQRNRDTNGSEFIRTNMGYKWKMQRIM